jgi:N-acetylglucosaminyl-diphospho-decaprenol L-rhamnosyltransferase
MELSIIIVNWNTRELLKQCLESVYACSPNCTFEVWVVDNASTDGSADMVTENFPLVRLITNQENVGFARGNNQAACQAAGRYIMLLNSDTIVYLGALDRLTRFMNEHPEAGASGPKLLNPDGSLQYSCYLTPTVGREFRRLFHLGGIRHDGSYPMEKWQVDNTREVDILQGAALLLRGDALAQVGLLDEGFFMYSEDYDLCYRIKKAGWHLYWVPWAEVVHFGGQSTRMVAAEMFLHLYASKLKFFRKHYGRLPTWGYKLVLTLSALYRLALAPLAYLLRPQSRQRDNVLSEHYRHLLAALPNL